MRFNQKHLKFVLGNLKNSNKENSANSRLKKTKQTVEYYSKKIAKISVKIQNIVVEAKRNNESFKEYQLDIRALGAAEGYRENKQEYLKILDYECNIINSIARINKVAGARTEEKLTAFTLCADIQNRQINISLFYDKKVQNKYMNKIRKALNVGLSLANK